MMLLEVVANGEIMPATESLLYNTTNQAIKVE